MKTLAPMTLKDKYFAAIEAEINRILLEIIYKPIIEIIGVRDKEITTVLKNSRSALNDAITRGTIWYEDGQFRGSFNSRTSAEIIKLGGVYNVKERGYSLPRALVPEQLKFAQTAANGRYEAMRERILSAIDNMDPEQVDLISKASEQYQLALHRMDDDLQKTLPGGGAPGQQPETAKSRITIEAELTADQIKVISKDWGNNLDLYIKKWTSENIVKLREEIQPHVLAGGRAEGLVKVIQDNYGVSARKAKFLARQETALLMSKFQETRYRDLGIETYRWSTAHDSRVRHDHDLLNGKVFRFDSPPMTNKKTGARNNPGQDFNCRCVAIPVFE